MRFLLIDFDISYHLGTGISQLSLFSMSDFDARLDALQKRLDALLESQDAVRREIWRINEEINDLRRVRQNGVENSAAGPPVNSADLSEKAPPAQTAEAPELSETENESPPVPRAATRGTVYETPFQKEQSGPPPPAQKAPKAKRRSNFERFVGENLISKIGIVILILGVAIGAKYAIDRELISPLTRIVIGYAFGFSLLAFSYRLREKYLNFSAVLLSGAMAILYFITFFAHTLYGIFNQTTAFVLMFVFTVFTVVAAIVYSRPVIANIGLVGAYAIPFLISSNTGNAAFLFSYAAIINFGMLAISVRKYWRSLLYLAFVFTWAIFWFWYVFRYRAAEDFNLAFLFLTVNFFTFYLSFLAYKLYFRQEAAVETVFLVLANSFIFYGIGYSILSSRVEFEDHLGLFTAGNAFIHFAFAYAVSRLSTVSRDLVYLLSALVLTFISIAVPVQFDGRFVTLLWTAEAAALFRIGRVRRVPLFENFSLPLMALSFLSLLLDWFDAFFYDTEAEILEHFYPFLNGIFLTGLVFALVFAFIFAVNRDDRFETALAGRLKKALDHALPVIGLFVLYNAFRMEIANYFNLRFLQTAVPDPFRFGGMLYNSDLSAFSIIWQIIFTMLFLTAFSLVNNRRYKSRPAALVFTGLGLAILIVFLWAGLFYLGELRESYLATGEGDGFFASGPLHILIRYISYAALAALFYSFYETLRQQFVGYTAAQASLIFDWLFYPAMLLVLTAELITWTEIFGFSDSHKLVTSIFWGVYAVGLIVLGINKNKKHLRLGAFALFAVTLVKLFFYDIADLGTISKTVVFVSLGILLLTASFLYNKYKSLIFESN